MSLRLLLRKGLAVFESRFLGRVALGLLSLEIVAITLWLTLRAPWPVIIPEPKPWRTPVYRATSVDYLVGLRNEPEYEVVVATPRSVDSEPCIMQWCSFEVEYVVRESLRSRWSAGTVITVSHTCHGSLEDGLEFLFWGESLFKASPLYFDREKSFLLVVWEDPVGIHAMRGLTEATAAEVKRWREILGRNS